MVDLNAMTQYFRDLDDLSSVSSAMTPSRAISFAGLDLIAEVKRHRRAMKRIIKHGCQSGDGWKGCRDCANKTMR